MCSKFVGNKAKRKMYTYQEIRNACVSGNLACFVFLVTFVLIFTLLLLPTNQQYPHQNNLFILNFEIISYFVKMALF